jgi:hypothetical protein
MLAGAAMINDDLVKCPLCGGFTHVGNPELLAALQNPKIREKVGDYVRELLQSRPGEFAVAAAASQKRDFNKEVHSWNPHMPVWRRSPKE